MQFRNDAEAMPEFQPRRVIAFWKEGSAARISNIDRDIDVGGGAHVSVAQLRESGEPNGRQPLALRAKCDPK